MHPRQDEVAAPDADPSCWERPAGRPTNSVHPPKFLRAVTTWHTAGRRVAIRSDVQARVVLFQPRPVSVHGPLFKCPASIGSSRPCSHSWMRQSGCFGLLRDLRCELLPSRTVSGMLRQSSWCCEEASLAPLWITSEGRAGARIGLQWSGPQSRKS